MSHWFFSWSGDAIPPPMMLVTTGDTHGGVVETLSMTADFAAGDSFLQNLSNAAGLTEGALVGVSGVGIPPGTLGVLEPAVGEDGAVVEINSAVQSEEQSITVVFTKAITVAVTSGDISGGSISNLNDTDALVPGVIYGVTGPGVPAGTIMTWAGGNGALLQTISGTAVETPDDAGVQLTFSAMPDAASNLITNVAGVADLEAGKVFNISGPGIPKGSTFVADGSDQIQLDQAASASALGASIVIDGPRVEQAAFDPAIHAVDDIPLRSVKISHQEGNFASLEIVIENDGTGLLKPGSQEWCWLSYQAAKDSEVVPVFSGRLVGSAAALRMQLVTLHFVGQPDNYAARKREIAEPLKVLPYYDELWLANGNTDDPDAVLETRSVLWHIDRVTQEVTTSDILVGEAGVLEIAETDHRYEAMDITTSQPPITRVSVIGTVSWTQQGGGTIDLSGKVHDLFGISTSLWGGDQHGLRTIIASMTGDGLKSAWPSPGTSMGGGWQIGKDTAIVTADFVQKYGHEVNFRSGDFPFMDEDGGKWVVQLPILSFRCALTAEWDASRKRTETVQFTMVSDLQKLISQPAGADEETISLNSRDIGEVVEVGGGLPIGDLRRNAYFATDRGELSAQYLMLLARAKIRARARAVEIKFQTTLDKALGISCRHNVHIVDRRLPGGEASGKVIAYDLVQDSNGRPYAEITIGCSIGRGGEVVAQAGAGAWVEAGAVEQGVQLEVGGQVELLLGEIIHEPLSAFQVIDDGLNLLDMRVDDAINSFTLVNGVKAQMRAIQESPNPITALHNAVTRLCLDLKPVQGVEFHNTYNPAVWPLPVPKTIDLEAA